MRLAQLGESKHKHHPRRLKGRRYSGSDDGHIGYEEDSILPGHAIDERDDHYRDPETEAETEGLLGSESENACVCMIVDRVSS